MSSDEQRDRLDGDTAEAAPLGQRIDMAAFASMETSQFVAVAMGSSVADEPEQRDPLEPLPQEACETCEPSVPELPVITPEQAASAEGEPAAG